MLQTSKYMNGGAPKQCYACHEPFRHNENHVQAWHGADGKYYCSQDCEQDELEAKARRSRVFS